MPKITCLAGGVGAARLLQGLVKVVPPKNITIIINTGDDFELHGLKISPDVDIVTYTLAGIVNEKTGWGINNDSFHCLEALGKLGIEKWFNLGDADLATHISRTKHLAEGYRLSEITAMHAKSLRIEAKLIPMTDDPFATYIVTPNGLIHFEEYLVHRGASDPVNGVKYVGAENSKPALGVIDSIREADHIIVCPSNPIVSIGTILSVPGVRDALRETEAKITAVSPIVGGAPVKGPADKIMLGLGLEVSAYAVAMLYQDFLDSFVIDNMDQKYVEAVKGLGINILVTNTIMGSLEDKIRLAETTLRSLELV
jgi:LPPG:FO 2-phospho-L-lactate transferase